MAKTIATITGTALRPGVSKNRRWYKPEHVAGAVQRAQERLAAGDKPMVMLSFHGAEDASREIAASLTGMRLAEDGSAEFEAGFTDTAAGWDIAKLADTSDGNPAHLKNVSIRGFWTGKVRKERGPDGQTVETADGLEIEGVDWTKAPGVDGAEIKTFSWVTDGQNETSERVLITESVQEATVTVTEETAQDAPAGASPAVPEGVREALAVFLGAVSEADNATPAMSKRSSGLSGSGRKWADPGYQADKRQRYDITTKAKALTAWRYIHQASKAAKYSGAQLKQVKSRIRAALKGFGVSVSTEHAPGWGFEEAYQVTAEVAEFYGDPGRAGSWSISASNGPVNLSLSSYSMDPADLQVILRAAAAAAAGALAALDPDMDGDVDVAGVGDGSDTDDDGGHESAPEEDDPATEAAPPADGGEDPAPAGPTESEGTPMPETTATSTEAGAGAPAGLTPEALAKLVAESSAAAVTAAFEAREAAKAQAKQEQKDAEEREAREAKARKDALTEALAELGIMPKPVTEAGQPAEAGTDAAVTETVDERVKREVSEAITEFKQGLIAGGAILPARAGLVVREHAVPDEDNAPNGEALRKMNDDDLMSHLGGAMAQHADSIRPVG